MDVVIKKTTGLPVPAATAPVGETVVDSAAIARKTFDASLAPGGALTPHQINSFAETVTAYDNGTGIVSAYIMGNAAALDPHAFPKGQLINYREEARVDPLTLTPESLHFLVMCPILPAADQVFDDAFFEKKLETLNQAAPQYCAAPITMNTRSNDNTDDELWDHELGDSGSVGVVRRKRGVNNEYFVTANCTAEKLGKDFIAHVTKLNEDGKSMTWRQAVDSKEFKYWREGVVRQACRIAYAAAEKMEVAIPTIEEDATYRQSDDQHRRVTARPQYRQWLSGIAATVTGKGRQAERTVTQYSQCSPVGLNNSQQDYHLVAASPFIGYVGVRLEQGFRPTMGALPCTTGRKHVASRVEAMSLEKDALNRIRTKYTWEGKSATGTAINDRLHPEAYRAFDDAFVAANFARQGWSKPGSKSPTEDLDVVIMKVAARKARPASSTASK